MRWKGKIGLVLGLLQSCLIVLFFAFSEYDETAKPSIYDRDDIKSKESYNDHYFPIFQNIHAMIFFGIGFLLTFIRKYGYTGLSMNMLLAAISIQVSILMQNLWHMNHENTGINFTTLILGEFAAASVLIALGGIFGKVSVLQMLFFAVFETIFYIVSEHLSIKYLQVSDTGGSVSLHLFAAAFGLSVAFAVDWKKKVRDNKNETTSYTSNIFCMLGTIFLFALWPCFNSALVTGDAQQRSLINTFLALLASCVTAFAASSYVDKEQKFSMTHIQNATLAGGVAIGTVTDLLITPAGALTIGAFGGMISVFGYVYVTPFLANHLRIYDPCGINSLHAIPGIFSGIFGAVVAAFASESIYGPMLYLIYPAMTPAMNHSSESETEFSSLPTHLLVEDSASRTPLAQAGFQLLYVVVILLTAIVTGLLTGFLLRLPFFEPLEEEDEMYTDELLWKIPKSKAYEDYPCNKCNYTRNNQPVLTIC